MERWDEPKFAEVEARLKALPEDAWAPEDHYLMVEWTAQRHLSHDEPFTEREWAAAKVRIKHKVDAALEELGRGGDHGQVAWERRETERRRLADRFREPLLLTEQQVRGVILPLLARFDFGPAVEHLSDEQVRRFMLACRDPYRDGTVPPDRYAIRDCQDSLRMQFHPAVLETAQALAANYELLLRARQSGCAKVKLTVRENCACMAAAFAGRVASVGDLIAAFEQRDSRYPILPEPSVACACREDPRICRVNMIHLAPVDETARDYDEDFQRRAIQILDPDWQVLDADWASRLNRRCV